MTDSQARAERIRAAVDWFVRDPDTGRVELAQPPNAPVAVFWAATAVQVVVRPPEPWLTVVSAVRWGSLMSWAGDEVLRGSSPARRAVGTFTLAGIAHRMWRRGLR